MSFILEKIDEQFIFDTEHIIMNYLKLNNFNKDCFKGTNIQISSNIYSYPQNLDFIQKSQKFANEYFKKITLTSLTLDLFSPFISSFPNSNFGLFITLLLKQNLIELSMDLNKSSELFEKYKKGILSIYHSVLSKEKHQKLLENICSSIAALIIIGFQGQWSSGIDQLISAAKQGDINSENNLIAALILANIENIYKELEEKLDLKSSKFILSLIDNYSSVINDYINYLLSKAFSGDKENFTNGELFKAFISILLSAKLFKINIIKTRGFLDFLINCISYIDVNDEFIGKIIEIFDIAFSFKDNNIKYDYEKDNKINDFILFINNISNNEDFMEIINCIKLIYNMTKYYDYKKNNNIANNPKDIQILFASSNIFSSILENYGYIFFIPDLDEIVQDIYNYFINIKINKINQIYFSSLNDLLCLSQTLNYLFDNYPESIRQNKKNNFLNFLYSIQNSILEKMKLSNAEISIINIEKDINTNALIYNAHQLDKYINMVLRKSISNDDIIEYIENSEGFYNDIYNIINSLFLGKDYCEKLCAYFISSTENKDFVIIDSLMNIFYFLSFNIINEYPIILFNLIEFIISKKDILFQNQRFVLQFIKLLYKEYIPISKNKKILHLIIKDLIVFNSKSEKFNQIVIILINKLILASYQIYKQNNDDNNQNTYIDKEYINNIFNIISNYLMEKLMFYDHIFLYKLIDAFYNTLFFTVALNINNIEAIITVSEKLLEEGNNILYLNNNNYEENILKYIFIIWSISKNIGKEKKEILFNLLNKKTKNNQESFFMKIQNNILKIIELNKNNNFNINIIKGVILVNNNFISSFMDKAILYYDYFNLIISQIISINNKFPNIFSLTLNLYNQIMTYNINTDKYNEITKVGFNILNSINSIYNCIKNTDDLMYLANKQTEFMVLYIQKSSDFINNLSNSGIFFKSLENIINIFELSNHKDFFINFINLIKLLIDYSKNNNYFQNILKEKFIDKIMNLIINHIRYFDASYYKCINICFYIFINCINNSLEEKFCLALNNCFEEKKISEVIINYLKYIINDMPIKKNDKKFKELLIDLKELYHGTNKIKYKFIEKYLAEINNKATKNMNDKYQTVKVDANSQIYMDLYAK